MGDIGETVPAMLRVGVTGHRHAEGLDTVRGSVAGVLGAIQAAGARATKAASVEISLVSQLAEGSDQLVAQAALDEGLFLSALIPFATLYDYAQTFDTEHGVKAFRAFAEDARTVFRLDGSGNEAFAKANAVMLANVDLILAVWDGKQTGKPGGTGDAVARAYAAGLPVVIVPPGARETAEIAWAAFDGDRPVDVNDPPRHSLKENLAEVVGAILDPGAAQDVLAEVYRRRWRLPRFLAGFWWLLLRVSGVVGKPASAPQSAKTGPWERFLDALPAEDRDVLRKAITTELETLHRRADELAVLYAGRHRGAFVLIALLTTIALVLGPFAALAEISPTDRVVLLGATTALIAAVIALVASAHHWEWHRKWLTLRALAEALRPQRIFVFAGQIGEPVGRFGGVVGEQTRAVASVARAMRRRLPLPDAQVNADYLSRLKTAAFEGDDSEVGGQIAYHRREAARMKTLDGALRRFHRWFLIGAFVTSLAAALMALGPEIGGIDLLSRPIETVLGLLLAGSLALSAATRAIDSRAEPEAIAERSTRMADALEVIQARGQQANSLAAVQAVLRDYREVITEDVGEWRILVASRPLRIQN